MANELSGEKRSWGAYVVAASTNYLPGLRAMLNSLRVHNNWHDVILLAWNFSEEDLNEVSAIPQGAYSLRLAFSDVEHQVHGTAIERFRVAFEAGFLHGYEAICLLDADMFFLHSCDLWMEVARAGFIVTGSNGMIIDFGTGYQQQYGIELSKPDWPYPLVHTSAPIFLPRADLDWFDTLYNSRRIDSWDDFLYLNILGIKLNKYPRMICLPPYTFTGIHHWQVKPETAIREKGGLILTGTEEQAYMSHGKWWDEGWVSDLPLVMNNYFRDENMGDKCKQRMEGAVELLSRKFWEYHDMK